MAYVSPLESNTAFTGVRDLLELLDDRQRFVLNGAKYGITPNQSGYRIQELQGKYLADRHSDTVGYSAAKQLKDALDAIEQGLIAEATADLQKIFRYLTVNKFASLSQMRRMGHPYARRHKRTFFSMVGTLGPPQFISQQGGGFSDAFTYRPEYNGGVYDLLVQNNNIAAGYLAMTNNQKMISRPYDMVAQAMLQQEMAHSVDNAEKQVRAIGVDPNIFANLRVTFVLGESDTQEKTDTFRLKQ